MAIQYFKDCTRCSKSLGSRNRLGLCRACAQISNFERSLTAKCERCAAAISADRKLGLCTPCYNRAYALDRPGFGAAAQARWRDRHKERSTEESRRYLRSTHGRFVSSRGAARRRGYEWTISKEAYAAIISAGSCRYCAGQLGETGSGLDRIDNNIGYTDDNVVPCCPTCNRIKCHILTHAEMTVAMAAVLKLRARNRLQVVKDESR